MLKSVLEHKLTSRSYFFMTTFWFSVQKLDSVPRYFKQKLCLVASTKAKQMQRYVVTDTDIFCELKTGEETHRSNKVVCQHMR